MSPANATHRAQNSEDDDYGLGVIARHNAATSDLYAMYRESTKGPLEAKADFVTHHGSGSGVHHQPLTPRSDPAGDGIQTRNGRSYKRTVSPYNTDKSQTPKSPGPKPKRNRKSKLDKINTPKLTAPLSVLTKDMSVPIRDIAAWVNRSADERKEEVRARKGYITRPMNSFMLYRSAYAERTKQWCLQNNHQVVSSVSGESWPMEPQEVRNKFEAWAKTERANHQAAHPNYKFSPTKASSKRNKADFSDDEAEDTYSDDDPDGEYHEGRVTRQRKQIRRQATRPSPTQGSDSHPYFTHQVTNSSQAHYPPPHTGQTLPSNVAYDSYGIPYNPHTNTYLLDDFMRYSGYPYAQEPANLRIPTPASPNGTHSLGQYGLPGGQQLSGEELYGSQAATPMPQYGNQSYSLVPRYPISHQFSYPGLQMAGTHALSDGNEHQRYLQNASQSRTVIDPRLEAAWDSAAANLFHREKYGSDHFDSAAGNGEGPGLVTWHRYYKESASPSDVSATLGPAWVPEDLD